MLEVNINLCCSFLPCSLNVCNSFIAFFLNENLISCHMTLNTSHFYFKKKDCFHPFSGLNFCTRSVPYKKEKYQCIEPRALQDLRCLYACQCSMKYLMTVISWSVTMYVEFGATFQGRKWSSS